jgi:CsoR family transcriptional regulator, copper-sensing transcriptional repressor
MTNKKTEQAKKIIDRISRIEGQVKGIKKMVESKTECVDVITQINAARQALAMLGIELLKNDFICKKESNIEIDEKYLKTLFKIN